MFHKHRQAIIGDALYAEFKWFLNLAKHDADIAIEQGEKVVVQEMKEY